MSLTAKQKLIAARTQVSYKAPYFRAALFGATYKESDQVPTLGITDRGVIHWNPAYLAKISTEETSGVLFHELMHWVRDHHTRGANIGADKLLFNLAGDMEINDDIRDAGFKLPDGAVFAKAIGEKDGNIAEVYYAKLKQQMSKQLQQQLEQNAQKGKKGGGTGDDEGAASGKDGKDGDASTGNDTKGTLTAGCCGSGAGNPTPGEDRNDKDSGRKDGQDGEPDGKSNAEAARMRIQVAEAVQSHIRANGQGSAPASLVRWAGEIVKPPKIDWRVKLAQLIKNSVAYRPGAVVTTFRAFGRKQAGIGYGPGKPVIPAWRNPVPRVAVVVDTSGSMGDKQLTSALRETEGVLKAVGGDVMFVACDAEVHSARKIHSWRDAVKLLKGGGGTDFRPAFDFLASPAGGRPEVIIFVTDGYGYYPPGPPIGSAVIWVISGGRCEVNWGSVVDLDDSEDEEYGQAI